MAKNQLAHHVVTFITDNRKLVLAGLAIAFLLGMGGYMFMNYRIEKETKLSYQINQLENEIEQILSKEAKDLADEDRLQSIQAELQKIYDDHTGYKNGLRAMFTLARIQYEEGDLAQAKECYLKVYQNNKKSYLAPLACLFAAIAMEDGGEFQEAANLLEEHRSRYSTHFSHGEAMLTLARNYQYTQDITAAVSILEEVNQNTDLITYHERAKQKLDIMKIQGLVNIPEAPKTSPGVPLLQ